MPQITTILLVYAQFFKGASRLPHVVHERVKVISLRDGNLERVVSSDVARQARQALLSRSTHADKQHVPARHPQDTGHRNEVHESVVEKHQVHLRRGEENGDCLAYLRKPLLHTRMALEKSFY